MNKESLLTKILVNVLLYFLVPQLIIMPILVTIL